VINGFWSVVDVKGGDVPTCRENATLIILNYTDEDQLTLIGGMRPSLGLQNL